MEMKTIADVLEKLKVDDIVLNTDFPIDDTLDEIVKFLKIRDFPDKSSNSLANWGEVVKTICREKKCYMLDMSNSNFNSNSAIQFSIKIADLKKAPYTFFLYNRYDSYCTYKICTIVSTLSSRDKNVSKKEWLEEINKLF